ncbi:type IV pilus modification protein PilV [Undibacterium sp. RuRC25W]|uniref:type IV pilus modification protein PilV n=1 Tax=Undibacterium sp. RuRC25W TaxID=3413047 RepID=UPI003BF1CC12
MERKLLRKSQGHSLIEVLISICILMVGAVGAINLQLASLRTAQQSSFYSSAVMLSAELAEKMRANDTQMKLTDGLNLYSHFAYDALVDGHPSSSKYCFTLASNCSHTDVATADIAEWLIRVGNTLPSARVVVCRDSEPYDEEEGTLTWSCNSSESASFVIKIGWQSKNPDDSFMETGDARPPKYVMLVESYVR